MTDQANDYFRTVRSAARGPELKVKGSRFIPEIFPVANKEMVAEYLASSRKEFYDATHHCYAYRLGPDASLTRAADDGEPASSAGKPILFSLSAAGLTNSLLIITRFYGGTKLGTGGLARAYAEAAKSVIGVAVVETVFSLRKFRIVLSYEDFALFERLPERFEIASVQTTFAEHVSAAVEIRMSLAAQFEQFIRDEFRNRISILADESTPSSLGSPPPPMPQHEP